MAGSHKSGAIAADDTFRKCLLYFHTDKSDKRDNYP